MCYMYSHGSVLLWQLCNKLRTSGFADDVMFSYGPESKYVGRVRQVAPPEAKLRVYDCMVVDETDEWNKIARQHSILHIDK